MDTATTFTQAHPELAGYSFEQELYPMQDGTESAETVKSKFTFDGNKVYEQTLTLDTGKWNQKYHLPHRRNTNIHGDVCADLCGQTEKIKYVEYL